MKKFLLIFITVVLILSVTIQARQKPPRGNLVLAIRGFRNNKGVAAVSLFRSKKGFPNRHEFAFKKGLTRIQKRKALLRFDEIPHGVYAVGVLHDENGNQKMDTNFLGIPREGYGTSKNVKGFMGPPKFKDAAFELTTGTLKLNIRMRY